MSSATYEDIWLLPFKSQEFQQGPELHQSLTELRLRLDHEREDGSYEWSAIVFRGVQAFAFTAHGCCSSDQVAAYDRLVLVNTSAWLLSLNELRTSVHHFRIYFDYIGCYDVAASEVEVRDSD
jgi:hypothetical protein